jgi:imidazoleglycerol-phosphate dehydratase
MAANTPAKPALAAVPSGGRAASIARKTKETSIEVSLDLDGTGRTSIETPLPFLSHMVDQLGRHGLVDLTVRATGDVDIDGHHTTEDLGLVIGQCVTKALADKAGILRYGSATLPMDEARVTCALDLSGRTHFVWEVPLPPGAKIGTWDVELAPVFFEAFARGAQCNLHMVMHRGENLHHIVEISFKALARALREAVRVDPRIGGVPSTKGQLVD